MIHLLGQTHHTEDGRSFYIESCQMLPVHAEFDVMVFDISKGDGIFSMGIAYPKEIVGRLGAMGVEPTASPGLMQHGLVQLLEHLDRGQEEDGRVFESRLYGISPSRFGGAWTRRHTA